jgi:hypothetical protein
MILFDPKTDVIFYLMAFLVVFIVFLSWFLDNKERTEYTKNFFLALIVIFLHCCVLAWDETLFLINEILTKKSKKR